MTMEYYIDVTDEYHPRVVRGKSLIVLSACRTYVHNDLSLYVSGGTRQVPDTCFVLLKLPVGDLLLGVAE